MNSETVDEFLARGVHIKHCPPMKAYNLIWWEMHVKRRSHGANRSIGGKQKGGRHNSVVPHGNKVR